MPEIQVLNNGERADAFRTKINDNFEYLQVGIWMNELALYGEQSYVGKDINKILQLISNGQIYNHDFAKTELLDTPIANGLHMGKIFKAMLGSNDTMWDSLATMDSVAASETAINALCANDVVWDVIASNEMAMTAIIASSTAMTAIAASSTAMTAIAARDTAMTAIGNSVTAMSTLWSNVTSETQNIIRNSTIAMTALRNCSRCTSATANSTSEITIYNGNAFVLTYKINATNSSYYMYVGRDKFTNNFYSTTFTVHETTAGFFTHASNTGVRGYSEGGTMMVYYIPC